LLCLVQVAVDNGTAEGDVWVLDPLADGGFDHGPLAEILADPAVEIVFHAGRQDVALLRRVWDTHLTNIFDTQVAAGFAGMRAQLGYEGLLGDLLGLRLSKSASFTRWERRPLSEEQLRYAREDVLHLLAASSELQRRLDASGRLEWAREECRYLEDINDDRDPDALLERLPRIRGLEPNLRAVARELVVWREQTAHEADRPASTVLQDAALVEIAKRRPKDMDRLSQIRGLNEGVLRRRGSAILEAVARGRELPGIPTEGQRPAQTSPEDAPLIALCESVVRTRALEADLAYELLAARADLQKIVTAVRDRLPEPDVRTLQGWRRELIGAELLALLAGDLKLRVGPQRQVQIDPAD
jgi:ribonuclease D